MVLEIALWKPFVYDSCCCKLVPHTLKKGVWIDFCEIFVTFMTKSDSTIFRSQKTFDILWFVGMVFVGFWKQMNITNFAKKSIHTWWPNQHPHFFWWCQRSEAFFYFHTFCTNVQFDIFDWHTQHFLCILLKILHFWWCWCIKPSFFAQIFSCCFFECAGLQNAQKFQILLKFRHYHSFSMMHINGLLILNFQHPQFRRVVFFWGCWKLPFSPPISCCFSSNEDPGSYLHFLEPCGAEILVVKNIRYQWHKYCLTQSFCV